MNPSIQRFSGLFFAVALACASTALADDSSSGMSSSMSESQQSEQQAGTMGTEQQAKQPEQAQKQMKDQAKMQLAPHAVTIESSLTAAREQLKGLRNGLKIAEDQAPSPAVVKHLQMISKQMTEDLEMAKVHQGELQSGVKKFPEIASSQDYRNVNMAVTEVDKLSSTFQGKTGSSEYWRNHRQVMNDLDNLERRLDKAIDETKSFSSGQLDFRMVG